jgi:hypothetical protein
VAYTADINIVVKGQAAVNTLQKSLNELGQKIDDLVKKRVGPSTALETFTKQLRAAEVQLTKVAAGTSAETAAVKNYVIALGNANAAAERQNGLIATEIKAREAATGQLEKLNARQKEFTERTDAAAQAARRQTAEFIRQQRIAKEVAALNRNAPTSQPLLPAAAAGSPAMSGGARSLITGPVERLGGARTTDQAATALRFAQALKEQVRPLSQIQALYAGIAEQSAKMQRIKALPDSAMLNAAGRGIKNIETAQDRYNRELQESAQRLQTLDRLEASRQRRAEKLRQIQGYYSGASPMANAGFGAQGPTVPPGGVRRPGAPQGGLGFNARPSAENLALGAGFPLLFGGGVGQVAGGLLGSFFGAGFGGQILGSAIGQQLEDALRRISDIGTATKTLNLDTLRDSVIAVNSDLDVTVERLIKAGQATAAQAEIAKQVTLQTGLLPEETAATSQAVNALGTAWNEIVGAVSGLLSLIGRPFVTVLAVIGQGIAKAVQGLSFALQLIIRTSPPLALLEKLFTAIGNALPAINEEQEKIRAEIEKQTDSYSTQIGIALKLEDIDKRRNKGNSAAAKINNNELDRQGKQLELNAKLEKDIQDVRLKYRGQNTKLLEDQIKGFAEIEKREINRAAARQRERLELEKINEQYGSILKDVERAAALGEQRTLLAQLAGALTEEEAQILNTLNEQSAVIDTILAKRQQLAALEKGGADTQQLSALVNEITALENKEIQLQIRAKKESLALFTQEIEAAAAAATRAVDLQIGALQGQQTLQQSQYTLMRSINDLQLQRLGFEEQLLNKAYEQASSLNEQAAIQERLERIIHERFKLAVANADVERAAALAQIQSGVELLKFEVEKQRIQYMRLVAVMKEAQAQGVLNAAHREAVEAQYGALQLSAQSLDYAIRNAAVQGQIANSMYNQKVEAAAFARNMELSALAAKRTNGYMSGLGGSRLGNRTTTTTTSTLPTGALTPSIGPGRARAGSILASLMPRFAAGGYVTGPTAAIVGEGGESEYIVPQSKASAFAANWMAGRRGAAAIPRNGMASAAGRPPTINITTGPVLQQNGQNWVTVPDMERALATLADTMLLNNRTPGGRRYQGVS